MLNALQLGLLASLVSLFPAQVKRASSMSVERGDSICAYLSSAECCQEMLKLASFRATREHLPDEAARIVKIGCTVSKTALGSDAMCSSLTTSRAFSPNEVKRLCEPKRLKRRCTRNNACQTCARDLAALQYPNAHQACYAVTYKRSRARGIPVVTIAPAEEELNRGDATVIVIPKRQLLR